MQGIADDSVRGNDGLIEGERSARLGEKIGSFRRSAAHFVTIQKPYPSSLSVDAVSTARCSAHHRFQAKVSMSLNNHHCRVVGSYHRAHTPQVGF